MTTELSGRDLDAAVAGKVFGATVNSTHTMMYREVYGWLDLLPYSSDWSAAGQLVEALRERGFKIIVIFSADLVTVSAFRGPEDKDAATITTSATFPESLARAALKTVEDKP